MKGEGRQRALPAVTEIGLLLGRMMTSLLQPC